MNEKNHPPELSARAAAVAYGNFVASKGGSRPWLGLASQNKKKAMHLNRTSSRRERERSTLFFAVTSDRPHKESVWGRRKIPEQGG